MCLRITVRSTASTPFPWSSTLTLLTGSVLCLDFDLKKNTTFSVYSTLSKIEHSRQVISIKHVANLFIFWFSVLRFKQTSQFQIWLFHWSDHQIPKILLLIHNLSIGQTTLHAGKCHLLIWAWWVFGLRFISGVTHTARFPAKIQKNIEQRMGLSFFLLTVSINFLLIVKWESSANR